MNTYFNAKYLRIYGEKCLVVFMYLSHHRTIILYSSSHIRGHFAGFSHNGIIMLTPWCSIFDTYINIKAPGA